MIIAFCLNRSSLLKLAFISAFVFLIKQDPLAQNFPNPATLSTGQGPIGTLDPIWQASDFWYNLPVPNPMGLSYGPALINNNCAPGAWVDPSTLPAPNNTANWITGNDANCGANISSGYRYFRLTLNLPADCNGYSVTVPGNYVLNFDGYVDNVFQDVFINGVPTGISGGGFAAGNQTSITLNGPWQVGVNYVDILIHNFDNGGQQNPYGLLLVANATTIDDTDNDGIPNISDLCPCDPGNNQYGCTDPALYNCDVAAVRTAFTNAGCLEMPECATDCSMYFLNPQQMTGDQAQAFAQTLGANLISVQSQGENDCLINSLSNLGYANANDVIWIGFNDNAVEGNFVWYDQSPVGYTNWAPGEPNNAGGENCTQIYPGNGQWNDLNCNIGNSKSIIEVNLCPVLNAGPDHVICLNDVAPVQATGTILGSQPYNYNWSNGVSGSNNPVSPAVSEEYVLTVTDRYDCTTTDTIQVDVLSLPIVGAGADQIVCPGSSVTLSGNGANTYNWDNGVTNNTPFNATATTTYTVTGTDINGCENTDQVSVSIHVLPTVNAGPDQAVCPGASVILSASGADTYSWDNGVTNNTPFTVFTTTTFTVTGTDINGCENTDQVTVTVHALPTVDAGIDQAVCPGASVTLSGSGADTYLWDNGITNNSPFNATTNTIYTVTGTDINGCENTDQVTVSIHTLPTVDAGIDQAVCPGASVTLSGSGADTYIWDNGITNNSPFNATTNTIYTVTGTDINGCENTDQVSVSIHSLPLVDAGPDQSVCPGALITLSGSGADSYLWDNGAANNVAFPINSTTTFTVTGTDLNGCENTDQLTVSIYTLPSVNAGNDIIVCQGEPVILNASGAQTYVWDNGVQNGGSFTAQNSGIITVTGTDQNACQNTDDLLLTVLDLPTVDFNVINPNACLPHEVRIQNLSPQASNCVWTLSSGQQITDCGDLNLQFTDPGCQDVSLTVTDLNGCVNTLNKVDAICTYDLPIADFEIYPDTELSLVAPLVKLTNQSVGADSYLWQFADQGSSTYQNPDFQFESVPGSYIITLIAYSEYGCTDTTSRIITIIDELIYYIPNTVTPDGDEFNQVFKPVFSSGFDPFNYTFLIYNRWGEIVFESHDVEVGWDGTYHGQMVKEGVYSWSVNIKLSINDEHRSFNGHVNVLR